MIELFIDNYKIDLKEDIQIDFTYETIDPNKLASIKNSYTKSITVPGTKANNATFGQIWRMDKYIGVNGSIGNNYDPHKKVNYILNKNGVLINRGYCTLDNIIIKSKNTIEYKLTLYGSQGGFFYTLSFNEDGSPKTLKDMFYNWRPKLELEGYGEPMTREQEDNDTIMVCSPAIVTQGYSKINPNAAASGTTNIDQDIVFVPCYTGYYNDFDSKHMLVSTVNQGLSSYHHYMDSNTVEKLNNAFPNTFSITEDEVTTNYSALSSTLDTTGNKYGLVTFSRDIDPFEAGDIRINEMPVAIRLSKLFEVIFNPVNNGGYEVELDPMLTDPENPILKYSWILLGKLAKENKPVTEVISTLPYDSYTNQVRCIYTGNSPIYSVIGDALNTRTFSIGNWQLNPEQYILKQGITLKPSATAHSWTGMSSDIYSSTNFYKGTSITRNISTYFTVLTRIYDGTTKIKSQLDVFYFKGTNASNFGYLGVQSGPSIANISQNQILEKIISPYNSYYNNILTINDVVVHNIDTQYDSFSNNTVIFKESPEIIQCTIPANINNLQIEQIQSSLWIVREDNNNSGPITFNSGIYGITTTNPGNTGTPTDGAERNGIFASYDRLSDYKGYWNMDNVNNVDMTIASFVSDIDYNIIYYAGSTTGFNIINLTKSLLFANTESPMKYLVDFAKLFNLKFTCDNINKKISILSTDNYYYLNEPSIDINDKIDLNRDINIKPVLSNNKIIKIGLETDETYPVTLFNRQTIEPFNNYKFDTGIDYNTSETEIFKGNIYKNIIDWQQSSIFYNSFPQMPKPYNTPSISWNLWDTSHLVLNELKSGEKITIGTNFNQKENLISNIDFLPKLSLFDNSNSEVESYPELIFFNGFIKNYDYTKTYTENSPYTLSPNKKSFGKKIDSNGNIVDSSSHSIYYYYLTSSEAFDNNYQVSYEYASSEIGAYVVNYYNVNGLYIGSQILETTTPGTNVDITIPSNAREIRINVSANYSSSFNLRKTRTDIYTISPKLMFSNDDIMQYYLNDKPCYISDFRYSDTFTGTGYHSDERKGPATSWLIPFFSRDWYVWLNPETNVYETSFSKKCSYNIIGQKGLDSMYSLSNTTFVNNPLYPLPKQTNSIGGVSSREFNIENIPEDGPNTRIFDRYWRDYLNDIYNRNNREVTCYVDLSNQNDPNEIMRHIYTWEGQNWIITKLHNYKVANLVNDKFTKVTMIKMINSNSYITNKNT